MLAAATVGIIKQKQMVTELHTQITQIQADIDEIKQVQGWQAARMGDISKQASRVRP
jgi:hypothetical protein